MFDAVDPRCMFGYSGKEYKLDNCPNCQKAFTRKRSNQKYCSQPCQKKATRNAARGDRSAEYKQRSRRHYELADEFTARIYSSPPQERLGVMQEVLSSIPCNAELRNVLTDQKLHKVPPRADHRMSIAKAANAYTKRFFGLSIRQYIKTVCAGKEPQGVSLF